MRHDSHGSPAGRTPAAPPSSSASARPRARAIWTRAGGVVVGGLLALGALLVPPRAAYACPLAPAQGAVCRYADPRLAKELAAIAATEAVRWKGITSVKNILNTLDQRVRRSNAAATAYGDSLKALKTPKVEVRDVFAASFNQAHPDANVRVTRVNGQTVVVNVGADADRALAAAQDTAQGGRTVAQLAAEVAALERAVYGAESPQTAALLARAYQAGDSAAERSLARSADARASAARVRAKHQGADGEAEAQILGAKGAIDGLAALQEKLHVEGLSRTIEGVERTEAVRQARIRALGVARRQAGGHY